MTDRLPTASTADLPAPDLGVRAAESPVLSDLGLALLAGGAAALLVLVVSAFLRPGAGRGTLLGAFAAGALAYLLGKLLGANWASVLTVLAVLGAGAVVLRRHLSLILGGALTLSTLAAFVAGSVTGPRPPVLPATPAAAVAPLPPAARGPLLENGAAPLPPQAPGGLLPPGGPGLIPTLGPSTDDAPECLPWQLTCGGTQASD